MGTEEKPKKRTGSFGKDQLKQERPAPEDKEGIYRSDMRMQHLDAVNKSRQPAKSVTFESDAISPAAPVELQFEPSEAASGIAIEELPAGNATAEEIKSLAHDILLKIETEVDTRELLTELIKKTPADSEVRHIAIVGLSMAEEQSDPEVKEILRKDTLRQLAHQPAEILRFVNKAERPVATSAGQVQQLARQAYENMQGQDEKASSLKEAVISGRNCLFKIRLLTQPRSQAHVIARETLELAESAEPKTRYTLYLDALNQLANVITD